ncbi:MAG: transposase, partial [Chloroflexota bacterium]
MSRYNPWKHHRRSVHLPDHDYVDGVYFVTVCAHHHECLFGDVVDDMMHRNAFGDVVHAEWLRTEQVRPYVTLDAFVVMPNHFHAVLFILPDTPSVGATRRVAPTR